VFVSTKKEQKRKVSGRKKV